MERPGYEKPLPLLPPAPPSPPVALSRRTRIVCISDTHNCTVKIPPGDVLIHCGDLTNQGSYTELSKQIAWLSKAPHECKIVVAGNHDLTLDSTFYSAYGDNFHNNTPQDPAACRALLRTESLVYLEHTSRTIRLTSPSGPRTEFRIFGSPYTPARGRWAFQYPRYTSYPGAAACQEKGNIEEQERSGCTWDDIPIDTDILVTHGPAFGHRDETHKRQARGCEGLRQAMWRVRPRLALCGHVHEGRGAERVKWDLDKTGVRYKEATVEQWEDPAPEGNKLCWIDLTAKGGRPLENDGSTAVLRDGDFAGIVARPGIGTRGLSGSPETPRSDQTALMGRLGRRETCIVNCAIMATAYPHIGPRRLNKAIVVDLDLPVWEQ